MNCTVPLKHSSGTKESQAQAPATLPLLAHLRVMGYRRTGLPVPINNDYRMLHYDSHSCNYLRQKRRAQLILRFARTRRISTVAARGQYFAIRQHNQAPLTFSPDTKH